jgi:hypothetical protein
MLNALYIGLIYVLKINVVLKKGLQLVSTRINSINRWILKSGPLFNLYFIIYILLLCVGLRTVRITGTAVGVTVRTGRLECKTGRVACKTAVNGCDGRLSYYPENFTLCWIFLTFEKFD